MGLLMNYKVKGCKLYLYATKDLVWILINNICLRAFFNLDNLRHLPILYTRTNPLKGNIYIHIFYKEVIMIVVRNYLCMGNNTGN